MLEAPRTPAGMFKVNRLDQKRSSYGFVLGLFFAFAAVGWAWFLFSSGYWDVQVIDVGGIAVLNREEVVGEVQRFFDSRTFRPWHKNNLLMLDTNVLSSSLTERLFVDQVSVEKKYPNVLRLIIKERQRSVIVVSQDRYVNVDVNGVVTGEVVDAPLAAARERITAKAFADESHLPVIVMNTADPLTTGFQVAKPEQVHRWLDVSRTLILAGLKFRFMKVEAPESVLTRCVSERGYDIYFDMSQPLEGQIATYQKYMKTKPDEKLITQYLDMRVPGKVYVK